jgi:MFS family permease
LRGHRDGADGAAAEASTRMKSALLRIYAFRVASGFVPIMSMYTLIFVGKNFSTFEISTLLASWSVAALLFEVPSGVVADKFDRRYVLCASQLITAVAFVVWMVYPHLAVYFLGFVLWGIGAALDSGTYEAFVYDELAEQGASEKYVDVLGRSEACFLLAVVAGFAFSAVFVKHGFDVLLWASCAAALVGAAIALSMPKARKREEVEEGMYFSMLRRGVKTAVRTPALARAIAIIAISGCITDFVTEYSPLFAVDRAVSASGVAIIGGLMVVVMAIASAYASKLPRAASAESAYLTLVGALIVAATWSPRWMAILLFCVSAAIANAIWIIARAEMQPHIDDDIRATTTSVAGFSQEVVNVLSLLAVGVVADQFSRDIAFRSAGIAIVIAAVALMALLPKHRRA